MTLDTTPALKPDGSATSADVPDQQLPNAPTSGIGHYGGTGTPFYWSRDGATLHIGPVPSGLPADPASDDAITALLPAHTHMSKGGRNFGDTFALFTGGTTWEWSTPTGLWTLHRTTSLLGGTRLDLVRGDGRVDVTVPPTADGMLALTGVLVAFGGLDPDTGMSVVTSPRLRAGLAEADAEYANDTRKDTPTA